MRCGRRIPASLPPRSALPRDVDIPALPGVGITWYDPGGKYWPRPLTERQARLWMTQRLRGSGHGTRAG